MLVLTRHQNQEIHIGDNIRIVIVKLSGSAIRIGIEAPQDVPIVRGELKTKRETFEVKK